MYDPAGVKTSPEFPVPAQMNAWVLGAPDQLFVRNKPTLIPGRAEVLVRASGTRLTALCSWLKFDPSRCRRANQAALRTLNIPRMAKSRSTCFRFNCQRLCKDAHYFVCLALCRRLYLDCVGAGASMGDGPWTRRRRRERG
jgi:hypothetical protein